MPAAQLRALSGVFRRQREDGVATGIQRGHDKERSQQIRDFVRFGYPYSEMSASRRSRFNSEDLRKPGWLPTAIVVNILTADDTRRGQRVQRHDLIEISESNDTVSLNLPKNFSGADWSPSGLPPLEVIDGQHRLYAFGEEDLPGDFELPVVGFKGLDLGWQAYLFWSINISPKKINPSHAFDLYPLLRSQDWLEKFAESNVYREARAQELTEFLYRHAESPWRNRINMLGERGPRAVSQAGWIRSLSSTYLAAGQARGTRGLFGCSLAGLGGPLPWTRPQQAAFLIHLWRLLRQEVRTSNLQWAVSLRRPDQRQSGLALDEATDAAFAGPQTMLNQEQGVRGFLIVTNDLFFNFADELGLASWETDEDRGSVTGDQEIQQALRSLERQPFASFMKDVTAAVAGYDWRSADAPGLNDEEKLRKRAFRGSGGYAALRDELMKDLAQQPGQLGRWAKLIRDARR